jgi:hypothetical protein
MRPLLLTFLLGPLVRLNVAVHARRIPSIEYPICRRNFTCKTPSLSFPEIMADLNAEKSAVDRMAEPAENEAHILGENSARKEAVGSKKEVETSATPKEEKLPKLSLADHRVYNSMAEHMEYFVS